jgi:hypothetical protein
MKKTSKQTRTVEVEVIDDVVCNKCGGSCYAGDFGVGEKAFEGLIEAEVNGGYYSKRLGDMNKYVFSLCEDCVVELFRSFKINPATYWWEGEGDYKEVLK